MAALTYTCTHMNYQNTIIKRVFLLNTPFSAHPTSLPFPRPAYFKTDWSWALPGAIQPLAALQTRLGVLASPPGPPLGLVLTGSLEFTTLIPWIQGLLYCWCWRLGFCGLPRVTFLLQTCCWPLLPRRLPLAPALSPSCLFHSGS